MVSLAKLLISDADPSICRWVALFAEGWSVATAAGGGEAVARALSQPFDLVLLDVGMAHPDGYAAAVAIRSAHGAARRVPIVAFTALRFRDPVRHLAATGIDDMLVKPCTEAALRAMLDRWRPPDMAAIDRLATLVPAGQLASLLARFRDELDAALARVDAADVAALAHRIAGLGGTLGFADVHAGWIALSEGAPDAAGPARIAARTTVAAIDRTLARMAVDSM